MTKEEAERFLTENDGFGKLMDYVCIDCDHEKAVDYLMNFIGCDRVIAQSIVDDMEDIIKDIPKTKLPHCPICGSTDLKRISATAKAVNTAMFGLLGNKRKHQWHCNNCKTDF